MSFRATVPLIAMVSCLALGSPSAAQIFDLELGEMETQCRVACLGADCQEGFTFAPLTTEPPFYIRNVRLGRFEDDLCNHPSKAVPVEFPVEVPPGGFAVMWELDVVAEEVGTFSGEILEGGVNVFDLELNVSPAPPCSSSDDGSLCLLDDRFTLRTRWRTRNGLRGPGREVPGVDSQNSGLFYFFGPANWEMLIKVLDGCNISDSYWVFYAATTNVEFTVTVTDTEAQKTRVYTNPLGTPAIPIQDTRAFATCP